MRGLNWATGVGVTLRESEEEERVCVRCVRLRGHD